MVLDEKFLVSSWLHVCQSKFSKITGELQYFRQKFLHDDDFCL